LKDPREEEGGRAKRGEEKKLAPVPRAFLPPGGGKTASAGLPGDGERRRPLPAEEGKKGRKEEEEEEEEKRGKRETARMVFRRRAMAAPTGRVHRGAYADDRESQVQRAHSLTLLCRGR